MRLLRTIEGELNKLFIFELEDGFAVEAVHYRGDTLCVSTQVGCHVGCEFCASGRKGLLRDLTEEEILYQYEAISPFVDIRGIAMAGIGEPLANWLNVKKAFARFKNLGLRVSFYTTGFPLNNLRELLHLPHNGVSISIHSTDSAKRKALMPYGGNLVHLISFLRRELPLLTRKKRRKVSLAYLLIKGVNDEEDELIKLGRLALELDVGITLLYYNQVSPYPQMSPQEYEGAFLLLRSMGVKVTLSNRFRKDRIGGCGTLTVDRNADIRSQEVIP